MRLLVLTNILAPYRVPLFEALKEQVKDLLVLTMAEREENRTWVLPKMTFPLKVLPGFHVRPPGYPVSFHINYGVGKILRTWKPDVVLGGGFTIANLSALIYCYLAKIPYVSWGEVLPGKHDSLWSIRGLVRRLFGRWSAGAVASSSMAKKAFCRFGIPSDRVHVSVMPIDVEFFHRNTQLCRVGLTPSLLAGRFSRPCLLYVGQLIPRKGISELFAMYEQVLISRPSASLVLVGDGTHRLKYEAVVKKHGWQNVHFEGFAQQESLPRYFAVADCFVFPTLADPFGAVLGEAMAAGILVVSSIHAAATHDLVEHGKSGFHFDPADSQTGSRVLLDALDMPPLRKAEMTMAAYNQVKHSDCPSAARTIVKFLKEVKPAKVPRILLFEA